MDDMDDTQKDFATIFYWAAYFGRVKDKNAGKRLVDIFMGDFGFSPFSFFYRGISPVFATMNAKNLPMFEYLVRGSNNVLKYI